MSVKEAAEGTIVLEDGTRIEGVRISSLEIGPRPQRIRPGFVFPLVMLSSFEVSGTFSGPWIVRSDSGPKRRKSRRVGGTGGQGGTGKRRVKRGGRP